MGLQEERKTPKTESPHERRPRVGKKEKVRTRHAGALAHRADDAHDLEDAADPPLVCAFDHLLISLHDRVRDRRELVRALAMMNKRGEDAAEEGKRLFRGVGVEVVLNEGGDQT